MKPIKIIPKSVSLDIQPIDLSVYELTIDEFVNCFSRHEGVLCIVQFGSLGSPGVSDLDLLIVCNEEKYRAVKLHSQEFAKQSPLCRYLFWHDVSVVPLSAMKHLLYFHSLENSKTIWGNSEILESCEKPDEIIILFREILWNSYFWYARLHLCQQEGASLRYILMICKNTMMSAATIYRLMGDEENATATALYAHQERQHILDASPRGQSETAKAFLWEAIQILAKSDWKLNRWMRRKGLLSGQAGKQKIQLSQNHVVVFDDSYESSQGILHQHIRGKHITYLPSYYYTIGCHIAQPYLQLQPELSRVWGLTAEHIEDKELRIATARWDEALLGFFSSFRMVGGDTTDVTDVIEFPFGLKEMPHYGTGIMSFEKGLVRRMLPTTTRKWLRSLWQDRQFILPQGYVRFGSLRCVHNFARQFNAVFQPKFRAHLLREMSYVHDSTISWGPPSIWEIETTSYCAGRCIMCPKPYIFNRTPEHMPWDLFEKIILQIKPEYQVNTPRGVPTITQFHYGSPFLYPYFEKAISLCKQRGFYVILSDIAALFTGERQEKAVRANLDEVWLMLEGMDNETSTKIRGPAATFDQGVSNIHDIIALKKKLGIVHPQVNVIMIRQPANMHQWSKFLQHWSSVEGVVPYLAYFSNFGGNVPEINQMLKKLQSLNGQPEEDNRVEKLNEYRCFYPWHSLTILSDGRVVPCCRDMNGTYILGDLRQKTLVEIWNDTPIQKLRQELISGSVTNPLCAPCTEANNEVGLPNRFYPGFNIIRRLYPNRFKANRLESRGL